VAALVAGLLLAGWAPAATADQATDLTLTMAQRWRQVPSPGSWSPYLLTVRNAGTRNFSGDLVLVPNPIPMGPAYFEPRSQPVYHGPVSVPAGTSHATAVTVVEPPAGYHAELRDGDRVVARADPAPAPRAATAVAVLSDVTSADQRVGTPLRTLGGRADVAVSRLGGPDLPASAVSLSGLNGLVLDQFDAGALSAGQVRAVEDFVALGGTLIETGGASWRRTLLPLPAELLALRPTATGTASVAALADLGAVSASESLDVATGAVADWARPAVVAADGTPLVVEGGYGAGRVVALAFDPLAAPFDTRPDLAAIAWSQAITRGLSGVQAGAQLTRPTLGPPGGSGVLAGSGPGSTVPYSGYLWQVLSDLPATASPPFGLLVAALVVYVLLVSVGTAAALRAAGRSGLLWVAVPALAVAFTAAAYLVGFGTRGADSQVVQVQVQRLGPGGVVETQSVDGVMSPRRGDVTVNVGPGLVVSTTDTTSRGPAGPSGGSAQVTMATRPDVVFPNVPVWDMRLVQTLGVGHLDAGQAGPTMPVEARLRLVQGRVQGQVVNHTRRPLRDVSLVTATTARTPLAVAIAPGATAAVDAQVSTAPSAIVGKGMVVPVPVGPGGVVMTGGSGPLTSRDALFALAGSQAVGRQGDLALVGLTDPVDMPQVDGGRPSGSSRALFVQPVRLQSADTVGGLPPPARLVSSASTADGGTQLDVYELEPPAGLTKPVGLTVVPLPQGVLTGVEVYDWSAGTWRPLNGALAGRGSGASRLGAGELAGGVVRVRVRETGPASVISLVDQP
jgi:hypothetical protein